jgi:hypothetical protein
MLPHLQPAVEDPSNSCSTFLVFELLLQLLPFCLFYWLISHGDRAAIAWVLSHAVMYNAAAPPQRDIDIPTAFVSEDQPAIWPPAWREVSTGNLGNAASPANPSGQLEQPFMQWNICMRERSSTMRHVVIETTSTAKGRSSTGLYVAQRGDGHFSHTDAPSEQLQSIGYGKNVWQCVRQHSRAVPMPADGCPGNERAVQLSKLEFDLLANDGKQRGYVSDKQTCYHVYVVLRFKERSLADVGLTVTLR